MNHDSPFPALGNTRDTPEVEAQVAAVVRKFAPGHDLTRERQHRLERLRRGHVVEKVLDLNASD